MNKYQIVETTEEFCHAGTKATADISCIAENMGFEKLNLRMRTTKPGYIGKFKRQIGYASDWKKCFKSIDVESVVLLQHPFHYPQITRQKTLLKLKKSKKVKFISVVHDVEELRKFRYNDYYRKEFEFMKEIADVVIVHNQKMKEFFIERGFLNDRLVVLKIFDYLQEYKKRDVEFDKSITVAGNLDVTKCEYIRELPELGIGIKLYGPNYTGTSEAHENVVYYGAFPVNEIPDKLNSGFGLVWDGRSVDGCLGESGQYLKYNNPHKLSLYLSSGLPVITWSMAAVSEFVKEHDVGICVDSLRDIKNIFDSLTQERYNLMISNVNGLRKKLISGSYTEEAIEEALTIVQTRS